MTYVITVPSGSDRYSLVSDLATMAQDTSTHLGTLSDRIDLCIIGGSSPTFATLSTSTPPSFPGITVTGTLANSSIRNDVNGFGLMSSTLKFVTTDGISWTSSAHVNVPNGGTGTQAINRNALNTEVATLNATISALTARVTALEANTATKAYVDGKDSTINATLSSHTASISSLNSQIAAKANASGSLTNVLSANSASSASNATRATSADNSDRFRGRLLAVGSFYAGTLAGRQSSQKTITHNLGYIPAIFATAYGDQGVVSILCSVESITATHAVIKYRNFNESTSEACSINWMAI